MAGAHSQWGQEAMNKLSTWKTDYTATVSAKSTGTASSVSTTETLDPKAAKARIHTLLDVMSANPPTKFCDQYRCVLFLFRVTVGEYRSAEGAEDFPSQEQKCLSTNFRLILVSVIKTYNVENI